MKNRLFEKLPFHMDSAVTISENNLYIVDWKNFNQGKVNISESKPEEINSIHISNENRIEILFDGFPENALPIKKGKCSKQCECVTFPSHCDQSEWVLFVETKYASSPTLAKDPKLNYPYCMVKQIKDTVSYFRAKDIISADKVVYAIISFPNILDGFSSWIFPIKHDGVEESILDILKNDKIIIRGTNKAKIIDDKKLLLIS